MKPLAIDLFCGMFGWSQGWLELGGEVVGFDLEHHAYHGAVPAGAHLVLQDVRTLHGAQFKDAALILASSPCQAYSFMAMPWTRAKQIARALRGTDEFPAKYSGPRTIQELNELFEQPKRIQREAIAAAGHYIPMIQENVRGAQPWVGRARWMYGSFALWGDVPALMPMTFRGVHKRGVAHWANGETNFHGSAQRAAEGSKNNGGSWFNVAHNTTSGKGQNPVTGPRGGPDYGAEKAVAQYVESIGVDPDAGTKGYAARLGQSTIAKRHGSKSSARKAASAAIARIPAPLARWIAQVYFPHPEPPTP